MKSLVVGGYGAVGRTLTRELTNAVDCPDQVDIAGRDGRKARTFASNFGDAVSGVTVDLQDTSSYDAVLEDVDQVVVCIDQTGTAFVEACLERGIDYIDVTASDEFFRQVEHLDELAKTTGSTAMLSVGLAPGITNLLATQGIERLSNVSSVRIGILLGLGETFGPAASRWTLERIGREYTVGTEDGPQTIRGFSDPKRMAFPEHGCRIAYTFDFADQHALIRTLDVPRVKTRLCFDSRAFTGAIYWLSRCGLYRPMCEALGFDRVATIASELPVGGDTFVAAVETEGLSGSKPSIVTNSIVGSEQSHATAIVAASVATATRTESVPDGVYHIHEVLDADPIFDVLAERGYRFTETESVFTG